MGFYKCESCDNQIHTSFNQKQCNMCLAKQTADSVNWPSHYNVSTIQPIDVIEAWELDFRLGNALKYLSRAGKKDSSKAEEDLNKAIWYIRRFIEKELKGP